MNFKLHSLRQTGSVYLLLFSILHTFLQWQQAQRFAAVHYQFPLDQHPGVELSADRVIDRKIVK